jgi:hypothetical protein
MGMDDYSRQAFKDLVFKVLNPKNCELGLLCKLYQEEGYDGAALILQRLYQGRKQ